MGGLILTFSPALIFILLVKVMFVDPIQPHKSFTMSMECFSLKYLSKTIIFHISNWLINNSTDVSCFESVSNIKVSYIDVLGSFAN